MNPKAKWSRYKHFKNVWVATVGQYEMEVETSTCSDEESECSIGVRSRGKTVGKVIWRYRESGPSDAVTLMRLCESELARRLHGAAETMRGYELLGTPAVSNVEVAVSFSADKAPLTADSIRTMAESIGREMRQNISKATDSLEQTFKDTAPRGWEQAGTSVDDDRTPIVGIDGKVKGWAIVSGANVRVPAEPRFKVGDLVRTRFRNRVGTYLRGHAGQAIVAFNYNPEGLIHVDDIEPYTLPPITTYAELADVLDELPEGWRVERTLGTGDNPSWFYRAQTRYFECNEYGSASSPLARFCEGGRWWSNSAPELLPPVKP